MANINKELTQIKTAIYGKDVRGAIHDGIDKINKESEDSKQKASEAHDVMESIINDGFDNAALEANFEQKLDDKIGQLQPEWTQFQTDVTSQLNEKAKVILSKNEPPNADDGVFWYEDKGDASLDIQGGNGLSVQNAVTSSEEPNNKEQIWFDTED